MSRQKYWSAPTAINAVNALFGSFLSVSPLLMGFREAPAAFWNAWFIGLAILVFAGAAAAEAHEWGEWVSAVLGVWTAAAPWVLGFADSVAATWIHLFAGLAVTTLATLELWLLHSGRAAKAP
ncbi:SPW repeat protein [Microvirga mediterraneensis]|uniref:SPW repeat protein n=1 Tax=Microvirga mediterraneensis TaxID=2754695 RepID=A0A838BUL8_9HYPH|nr:SPW repeat protein [Microvirga mediterraneensis]MBA1158950.1 SPW repeat protein [Microvirga mediterraneensis]